MRMRADLLAGLSIAGLLLPEAVAYAGIAGLGPQHAILAAIAGALTYALLGRSRFAVVAPTSSSAAILAATLATLPGDETSKLVHATVTVALTGVAFLAASLARLGGLTGFVSRPVLRGFAFGLAITIILKQLPALVGLPIESAGLYGLVRTLLSDLPRWHGASLATGIVALAALLALRRLPWLPGAFIVVVGGIVASLLLDLPGHGVAVVGTLKLDWPHLAWPDMPWSSLARLAQFTLPLALILLAESWGTMRALALRHGDSLEPNRELLALGGANLASALVQGLPVGAGFSAGQASAAAGTQTRAAAVFAALGMAVLVAVAARYVAALPHPVLAAVVIAALSHALDPRPLLRLWRLRRDHEVALLSVLGVLVLGVLDGMLGAIVLSIAVLIRRMSVPRISRLGRLREGHDFVDVVRHPDAREIDGLMILRPSVPLFFANAERVLSQIDADTMHVPTPRVVIVSLEDSFDLDSTALDALLELDARLKTRGTRLVLARVHDELRDLLAKVGATDLLTNCAFSVDDAVALAATPSPRSRGEGRGEGFVELHGRSQ